MMIITCKLPHCKVGLYTSEAFIRTNVGPVSSIERLKQAVGSNTQAMLPGKVTVVDENGEVCDTQLVEKLHYYCGETDPAQLRLVRRKCRQERMTSI